MQLFATDLEKLAFLLEAEADLAFEIGGLEALGAELATDEVPEDKRPKYITNYIGSKQKLVDWIWKHTPEGAQSVADAFCGSSVVAYMYKTKGLKVSANDRLRYSFHGARALVENQTTRLPQKDLDALLAKNPKAGTFVQDHFKGIFFAQGVHEVIDQIRANIDKLSGYQKDIALFALGKTCLSAKGGFGHFTSVIDGGKHLDTPDEFRERFSKNVERINALVFDSGKECQANNKDVNEFLAGVKADLAYFDPPYATEFSTTNYEKAYHFIEGLMSYWDGLKINEDSKVKFYETDHQTVTKANAKGFFETFLGNAKHIANWLISYRDHAYPNEDEMKGIIGALGRNSTMESKDHHYSISARNGDASNAQERLFICKAGKAVAKTQSDIEDARVEENMAALAAAPLGEEIDLLACQAGEVGSVRVTGYMGSKYVMLGWIEKHLPQGATSVLDAFSGGANVAYHFKRKGMKVYANDLLRYPYHLIRAVIENSSETLSDADIERLLAPNANAGTFIVDHFHGYYYTKPILAWLDQVWANTQKLPGYKKDLALAALGNTVKAKSAFGFFTRSKMQGKAELESEASLEQSQLSNIPLSKFFETFRRSAKQLNALVFDNGQECKAFNLEATEAVRRLGADVLYLDPPYVTEFGTNDYEDQLHFVEGLMTRWADKQLLDNPRRSFSSRTRYNKESMTGLIKTLAGDARGKFGSVLLSYRDRAFPDEEGIRRILGEHFGAVRVAGMEVDYNIAKDIGKEGTHARELLFVADKARQSSNAAAAGSNPACHTAIPVEIRLSEMAAGLSAEAMDLVRGDDPQFTFILCRTGTNKNGDNFTPEELSSRYMTAVNKKVDLKHSQDFTDIVGGIVASDFLADESGGRVECVGELYVGDSQHAQLAYKLMKRGIITQVSMECDYEEGECSICGKRVKNKTEYCPHLAKFKGGVFDGKPVFEILHGVTFTGLGLLDRKGADENARITQVATINQQTHFNEAEGGPAMDDKTKDNGAGEAAKKKPDGGGGGFPPADAPGGGDKATQPDLEKENKALKQKVLELQKRIDELEAEQKAAANKARAQKLVSRLEKQGIALGDEEERESELKRLAGLSDDAFAATEAAWERMVKSRKAEGGKPEAGESQQPEKKESQASAETPLRSDAGVRPREVDDRRSSLEDQLREGFMAAYKSRVAQNKGDLAVG